ncbi:MAG: transketolase [Planctomycetia bacterium]|nr:transketolase [Planctomycetia bacterium]
MRNAFADELLTLAERDDRIVFLSGDIGNRLFDKFKARFPERFFNCGVAEQNMIGMGAGMALSGLRPICYTIASFATVRCLEQIRVDVCYHDLPVTIVGVGAGLGYAELGATHHACEDIAMLRSLPNMAVVCPGDPLEVRGALAAAVRRSGPVYLRLGKKGEPIVHATRPDLEIGKAIPVRTGRHVALLVTGTLLPTVVEVGKRLAEQNIEASIFSFHTVKPLDEELLASLFAEFPLVATIEEHSLVGGFGGAVAEWIADRPPRRARLLRFGTRDEFLHVAADEEYARRHFGLDAESIAARVVAELKASS